MSPLKLEIKSSCLQTTSTWHLKLFAPLRNYNASSLAHTQSLRRSLLLHTSWSSQTPSASTLCVMIRYIACLRALSHFLISKFVSLIYPLCSISYFSIHVSIKESYLPLNFICHQALAFATKLSLPPWQMI